MSVNEGKNGQRKCGAFTQWHITQLLKNEIIKSTGKWMGLEKNNPE